MTDNNPLALYIHWPFCVSKCPYCDFNSHVRASIDQEQWRNALLADLAHEATLLAGRKLGSIFFGGGTPSLMPPETVSALIDAAAGHWQFERDIEITLEANPSSVEASRFTALATAGINRVSLGLQALDADDLHLLGRAHDVGEGLAALAMAQRYFPSVSFDLIYALPDQTPDAWQAALSRAIGFGTTHLSLYQLTIEPGTRFATWVAQGRLKPLDPDRAADLFTLTQALCGAAGIAAYEISNHARAGAKSRHNLTYWRYGDYAGIGPGAHGRRCGMATVRHRKPENWLDAIARNGHGLAENHRLMQDERAREALLMGLRLYEGVDLSVIARQSGIAREKLIDAKRAAQYERVGLMARTGDRLAATPAGMLVLDHLLGAIVTV